MSINEVFSGLINELSRLQSDGVPGFQEAVDIIVHKLSGRSFRRIMATGVGKARFSAEKLVATLNSFGISSQFVHPTEALHGDLGNFVKNDILIAFSNSGESYEVLEISRSFAHVGGTLIAVTGNKMSSLARSAQVTIAYGTIREAGHLNVAPTTSVSLMLAIADALAVQLAACFEVSRDDFSANHPGGLIGKSLTPIKTVMRHGEFYCAVPESSPLQDAIVKYSATPGRPGCTAVIDDEGKLVGVFTDGNLRRLLISGELEQKRQDRIREVMTRNPKSIGQSALVKDAMELMLNFEIDQLIVVDEADRPVGLIDIQDASRLFLA